MDGGKIRVYFETYNKEECNGCTVCMLKCPKKAITMMEDKEGFLYPKINKNLCNNCGICKKICTNNNSKQQFNKTYLAFCKNKKILNDSSSGGVFYPLAKKIIEKDGLVCGVAFNEKLQANHIIVEKIEDLVKLQGSKYVRSNINNTYVRIKEYLEQNRFVLFTGTPCQCNALKVYLRKDYSKLYTCEIICHSNPSPKVFELYKKNIENIYNKKIKNIKFRDKSTGWKNQTPTIILDDNTILYEKTYLLAFGKNIISRPSCHSCKFATSNRVSDFTIGDFWGIDKIDDTIKDNDTGISIFNINTIKGQELQNEINELYLKEYTKEEAFRYNHNNASKKHKKRDKFFKKIETKTIDDSNIIKYMKRYAKGNIFIRIVNAVKYRIVDKIMVRLKKGKI